MDHDYHKFRGLHQNDIILVLGAFYGDYIREYKTKIIDKNVFVINVEPHKMMAAECSRWIADNMPGNAVCLNLAVFDKTGINDFDNKDVEGISSISIINNQFHRPVMYKDRVLTVPLDYLLSIVPVNCIFCDIEGAEIEVFENSKLVDYVDYIAIAAYHVRDDIDGPTHKRLLKRFPGAIVDPPEEEAVLYWGKI